MRITNCGSIEGIQKFSGGSLTMNKSATFGRWAPMAGLLSPTAVSRFACVADARLSVIGGAVVDGGLSEYVAGWFDPHVVNSFFIVRFW